jgi:PAS domain-containing protein
VGLLPSSLWNAAVVAIALIAAVLAVVLIVQTRARRRLDAMGMALQQGHALKDAILSSLPARIAVLDRRGTIIAVNASWAEATWPSSSTERVEPGANFFDLCRAADAPRMPERRGRGRRRRGGVRTAGVTNTSSSIPLPKATPSVGF